MIQNPVSYNGVVSFSALIPQGDVCSPSGQSRVYAINYGTGTSVLTTNSSTSVVPYLAFPNSVDDLRFIRDSHAGVSKAELIAGTSTGAISQVPATLNGTIQTRLLNWREIPTVE